MPRKMGEGSWARVVFGRQPDSSPMRGQSGCAVAALAAAAGAMAALAVPVAELLA